MNRIAGLFVCSLLCLPQQVSSAGPGTDPAKYNVLFILVDDLRPAMGAYGDPAAITPQMDRLAGEALLFERAYVQIAVCSPSRTSLLTGLRPDNSRVWDLRAHFRDNIPDQVTLPQYFKQNGYHARSIGKIYHGVERLQDSLSWSVPERFAYEDKVEQYLLPENRRGGKAAAVEFVDAPDSAYLDGKIADAAIDDLRELRDEFFFLAVGFKKPHLPFAAPKRYWDLYDADAIPSPEHPEMPKRAPELAYWDHPELGGYADIPRSEVIPEDKARELRHGYYACVSYVDAQIGRVLDALRELGLEERTIVILWGDHGFHLGEQDHWAKGTNFELDTRIPLLVKFPGQRHAGARTAAIVETVDLYPTVVELAGLPPKEGLDGTSLVPLLEDPSLLWKEAAFSQFARPWSFKGAPETMGYSLRTDRYRYTEWVDFETGKVRERELYDFDAGMIETENVAAQERYADVRMTLEELLREARRGD